MGLDLNVDEEVVSLPRLTPLSMRKDNNNRVLYWGYYCAPLQMLTYFRSEPFNLSIDTFTVVRDRATGQSRGFGFALFASLDCAVDFVKG